MGDEAHDFAHPDSMHRAARLNGGRFRVVSARMALLSDAQIDERPGRRPRAGVAASPGSIEKEWKLADFAEAIGFVDRVAEIAEAANHHPDILLHGWNKVRLTLSTHSQGGLTDADFKLASQIDGAG